MPFLETLVIPCRVHRGYQVSYTPGNNQTVVLKITSALDLASRADTIDFVILGSSAIISLIHTPFSLTNAQFFARIHM